MKNLWNAQFITLVSAYIGMGAVLLVIMGGALRWMVRPVKKVAK